MLSLKSELLHIFIWQHHCGGCRFGTNRADKLKAVTLWDQKLGGSEFAKEKRGKALAIVPSPVSPPPPQGNNASVAARKKSLSAGRASRVSPLRIKTITPHGAYICYSRVHPRCVITCGQTVRWRDDSSNASQEVGSWIRRTQFNWPLVRCLCLGSFWRYCISQEPVKHWANPSSSPGLVRVGYEGGRCSRMEGCASVPHNGPGSNSNTTVQPCASFNGGTRPGLITRLHSQKDYQIPPLPFPFKWTVWYACLHRASRCINKPPLEYEQVCRLHTGK